MTFDRYATFYDALYASKDYAAETAHVLGLLRGPPPSLLELGCGTGGHALCFARAGVPVLGVDVSAKMIELAQGKARGLEPAPRFVVGDARTFRVEERFAAAVSLFHVLSYQITNADLLAMLTTARAHLAPGGRFVFDCWFGPGVLSDPPTVTVRRWEGSHMKVLRLAEPTLHADTNTVTVAYTLFVEQNRRLEEVREVHRVRYYFLPELEDALQRSGMRLVSASEWLSEQAPSARTFSLCCVAEAC